MKKYKKLGVMLIVCLGLMLGATLTACTDGEGLGNGLNLFASPIEYICEQENCQILEHAHNACEVGACDIIVDHLHNDNANCTLENCTNIGIHTHCDIGDCTQQGIHSHNNCGIDGCDLNGHHSHSCNFNGCSQSTTHSHGSCGVSGCNKTNKHSHNSHGNKHSGSHH